MTFDDIARRVIAEAGLSEFGVTPQFVLLEWLKSRYLEILTTLQMTQLANMPTEVINTTPAYSQGLITLTQGSDIVTGTGTFWFSNLNLVGQYLRPGIVRGWYKVIDVFDPTTLQLDAPFADTSRVDSGYFIAQRYYTLQTPIRWLMDVKNISRTFSLNIVSMEKLDSLFPDRVSNPTVPQWVVPIGVDAATGHRVIEIYPFADQIYRLELTGYGSVDEPTLLTSPLSTIDPSLLIMSATADGLRYRARRDTNRGLDNIQGLSMLARNEEARYTKALEDQVYRENLRQPKQRVTLYIQRRDTYGIVDPLMTAEDEVWSRSPAIG